MEVATLVTIHDPPPPPDSRFCMVEFQVLVEHVCFFFHLFVGHMTASGRPSWLVLCGGEERRDGR